MLAAAASSTPAVTIVNRPPLRTDKLGRDHNKTAMLEAMQYFAFVVDAVPRFADEQIQEHSYFQSWQRSKLITNKS
jgi:hypothetical protein